MCKFGEKNFADKPIVLTERYIVHLDKPQIVLSKRNYYQSIEVLFAALLKFQRKKIRI